MKPISVLFFLIITNISFAQNDVFNNEVVKKNGKIYYKNKLFSGTLYSDTDGVPNKCDCTLKASYLNGLLKGTKKEWYRTGKLKYSGKFINGKKTGIHISYYKSGRKKSEIKYANGSIINKKLYYNNGKLRKVETYKNKTVVSSVLYNRDGTKKASEKQQKTTKIVTSTTNDKKNTIKQSKKSDVKQHAKKEKTMVVQNINLVTDGLQKSYFSNGNIKRIAYAKDGLLVKDSLFYPTGKMKLIKKFFDGELIHSEKYNQNEKLLFESNFENNKKHGFQKENYENGNPKIIENYENGMLNHREVFFENGSLKVEENFRFNKKQGIQKYYDDKSVLKELEEYNNNKLIRHEKYTNEGKELISIVNNLSKIKTYNSNNKLIKLAYENIVTKKPDSLCVTYNPENGNKLEETAYNEGKIIRKGKYSNNKKDGKWVNYWLNGKKETHLHYKEGVLLSSQTYTYAKQIKNNLKKSDLLFSYITYTPKETNNYILVRIDSVSGKSKKIIKEKIINSLLKTNLKQIDSHSNIQDKELFSVIHFKNLQTKLKSKTPKNIKFVYLISIEITLENFINDKTTYKKLIATPATKTKGIKSFYTKDKKEAYFATLFNFEKELAKYLSIKFPLSGVARKRSGNNSEVWTVYINIGKQQGVNVDDVFVVYNEQHNIKKVQIRIKESKANISIGKVIEGDKWLYNYLKTNDKIQVFRLINK